MGCLTWLCVLLCSSGEVTWTSGYVEGLEAANRRSVPLVVFVHGSDWNQRGVRLEQSVWRDRRTRSILADPRVANFHLRGEKDGRTSFPVCAFVSKVLSK